MTYFGQRLLLATSSLDVTILPEEDIILISRESAQKAY